MLKSRAQEMSQIRKMRHEGQREEYGKTESEREGGQEEVKEREKLE